MLAGDKLPLLGGPCHPQLIVGQDCTSFQPRKSTNRSCWRARRRFGQDEDDEEDRGADRNCQWLRARGDLPCKTRSRKHMRIMRSLTHSLTLSLTHSLTRSLAHSLTRSLSLTHTLAHTLARTLARALELEELEELKEEELESSSERVSERASARCACDLRDE